MVLAGHVSSPCHDDSGGTVLKLTGNKPTPKRTKELPQRNLEQSDFRFELLGGSNNNTGHIDDCLLYDVAPLTWKQKT